MVPPKIEIDCEFRLRGYSGTLASVRLEARMDLGVAMSRDVFEDKLDHARDGKGPEATWNTRRLPKQLTPGWTNRLWVAVDGAWRGWFPLSGEVLWNPEDDQAPYALIFDTRRWTPVPPTPAPRFRSWRYLLASSATHQAALK
jgi:hypothetical protein